MDTKREIAIMWNNKGHNYIQSGKYDDAKSCFEYALNVDSTLSESHCGLGDLYVRLSEYDEAISCYDKAISIDAAISEAWNGKGNALSRLGELDESISCYKKAIEIDDKNIYSLYGLGNALGRKDELDEAIKCYDKAIGLNKKLAEAWYGKGLAYGRLAKFSEAVVFIKEAFNCGLDNVGAHVFLAYLYRKIKNEKNFKDECLISKESIENQNEYSKAGFQAVCGDPDRAIELLRIALDKKQQHLDWVRKDIEFDFIRENPKYREQFSALLDEFSAGEEKGPE